MTTYSNLLGGSGMTLESAVGVMFGLALFGALLGIGVGLLLKELRGD